MVGDSDKAELLSRYFKSVFTADDDRVHDVKYVLIMTTH